MRVLVACERTGRVRDALLARGHDAISCDIEPTDVPGPHIQGDVRPLLKERWDMVIAHPECTYLANSAAKHLYVGQRRWNPDGTENPLDPERVRECAEAAAFFLECLNANAPRVAVENPVMHWLAIALTRTSDPKQTVQPWWFGDRTFKATTFRLRGLKPLRETNRLVPPPPWKRRAQEMVLGVPVSAGPQPQADQVSHTTGHRGSHGRTMGG